MEMNTTTKDEKIHNLEFAMIEKEKENKQLLSRLAAFENQTKPIKQRIEKNFEIPNAISGKTSFCSDLSIDHVTEKLCTVTKENEQLATEVCHLKKTIEKISVTLETSVALTPISKASSPRKTHSASSPIRNMSKYKHADVEHLIKLCKVYVLTIDREIEKREELENKLEKSNDQISDLTMKLEGKQLEIKALERITSHHPPPATHYYNGALLITECGSHESVSTFEDEDEDASTVDEIRSILAKRNMMVKQLRKRLNNLKRKQALNHQHNVKFDLRKISVLQEMQDATIRRFSLLLNRTDDEHIKTNLSFLVSMPDKILLLHDSMKTSLHLMEVRLSNEIESLSLSDNALRMDESVESRFERTIQTLQECKAEFNSQLDIFKTELSIKDDVIKDLLKRDHQHETTSNALQSELDILRALATYSTVDEGVMTRLQECSSLEEESQRKDRIVQRLRTVNQEYLQQILRFEEPF